MNRNMEIYDRNGDTGVILKLEANREFGERNN